MKPYITEQDMYTKDVVEVMTQAGLIPVEEEVSYEEYLRETSRSPTTIL